MSQTKFSVEAPRNPVQARALMHEIIPAMIIAHTTALKRAFFSEKPEERDRGQHDVELVMEAQMALCAIEMYLLNQELEQQAKVAK
jgi:hypothetical protein